MTEARWWESCGRCPSQIPPRPVQTGETRMPGTDGERAVGGLRALAASSVLAGGAVRRQWLEVLLQRPRALGECGADFSTDFHRECVWSETLRRVSGAPTRRSGPLLLPLPGTRGPSRSLRASSTCSSCTGSSFSVPVWSAQEALKTTPALLPVTPGGTGSGSLGAVAARPQRQGLVAHTGSRLGSALCADTT